MIKTTHFAAGAVWLAFLALPWGASQVCAGPEARATVAAYPTYNAPTSTPSPTATTAAAATVLALPDLVKKVKPAVVKISMFNASDVLRSTGSGFFVGPADVVTNCHVIADADHGEVKTLEGETLKILGVVADNREKDLVRLQVAVPQKKIEILTAAPGYPLDGDHVVVVGNPIGLEQSVSDGIVAAIRDQAPYGKVIQITAPVSPGNSGGPVVNTWGELLGVVCFQYTRGQNLNFSIPAEAVTALKLKPLRTVSEWNRVGAVSSHSAAAQACQVFFAALDARNYQTAWSMLTRTTQRVLIDQAATAYGVDDAQARGILEGTEAGLPRQQGLSFWDTLRDRSRAHQRYTGTFGLKGEEGDAAVVTLTELPGMAPEPYLMYREDGVWKCGLAETADQTRRP